MMLRGYASGSSDKHTIIGPLSELSENSAKLCGTPPGHLPEKKNRNEERQEQGTDGREEAGDVGAELEDKGAPPSQHQSESAETREPPNGMEPPTPQPRLKRLSHGPSQNEDTENDEGFVMVAKKN
ncbi:hypothetical protein EOD39_4069 [Acipenser ruthenus]|uniref:Uncharacterized protein n=1 Tax=Acipenser ruthenus TaxID=7906 RepID=A0A444UJY8_ACIRT|nr:hypothetical protein EOD39_4069 [Acipenser ruthenus]